MATGTIYKNLTADDIFVSPSTSVNSGIPFTITFSATRDSGLISITGNGADRIALYAFSGMNGITPSFSRLSGANLDSSFSTAPGKLIFTPGYGAFVKVLALNTVGRITTG